MARGLQGGDRIVQASIDDSRHKGVTGAEREELRLLRRVVGQFRPYRGQGRGVKTPGLIYLVTGFAHDISPGTLVAFLACSSL